METEGVGADMSMISAQCDELRGMADELAMVTKAIHSGVPASTWRGMTYVFEDSARSLRRAADTIWELRCKLAGVVDQCEEVERLKAENAKLRDAMYTNAGKHALQHMDEDELRIWATQQSEYIDQLEELVRDMWRFTGAACKKYPRLFDPAAAGGQMVQLNALDAIEQRMRELGVLEE